VVLAAVVLAVSAFAGDVTGKWTGKQETPNGTRDVNLTLKQDGDKLTGAISGRGGETPIQDGKVDGDKVTFVVVRNFNGNEFKMQYNGVVAGSELKLKFRLMDSDRELTLKKAE
jgi:hypothetical protein